MELHNRTIVIDAAFSQEGPFDAIQIMQYIAENEIQGKTLDHHDIAFYLDHLREQGLIRKVGCNSDGYEKYVRGSIQLTPKI
jgi:hypothetical protein